MSLCLWLPLNGDLHNQGLDGKATAVTATNGSFVTNGKIGKCLKLGYTNNIIIPSLIGSKKMSWAYWCRIDEATATNWLDPIHWTSTKADGSDAYTSRQEFYTNCTNTGVWYKGGSVPRGSFGDIIVGEWNHFAFTIDYEVGEAIFYINGNQVSKGTTVDTTHQIAAIHNIRLGENGLSISENDVRIYDQILSPREIKELSKGLVLHYPLNRGGFGQDNLLLNSTIPTSGSGATGITKYITDDGLQKVVAESPNGNWCTFGNHNTTLPLTKGDSFTFSMMIKSPDSTKKPTVYFQSGLGYYSMQGTMSNNWSIIYYTGIWNIDNLSTNIHLGFSSAPGTYYIKYFKLEKGSVVTPWIPNPADALYSDMGLDDGIEYDVSGYGNNGTVTGSLTYSSDTPRYNVCTSFNGTDYIVAPSINGEIKTMSAWFKTTKNKSTSQFICAEWNSKLCISLYSGTIISYFGTSPGTGSKCTLGDSYIENGWNHVVVIATGDNTRDVYCNGVKLTPANNDYWGPAAGFLIGSRNSSGTLPFYGSISDVRAYATRLTEDDILALYHTPTSIASNGTLLTQGEIVEV